MDATFPQSARFADDEIRTVRRGNPPRCAQCGLDFWAAPPHIEIVHSGIELPQRYVRCAMCGAGINLMELCW